MYNVIQPGMEVRSHYVRAVLVLGFSLKTKYEKTLMVSKNVTQDGLVMKMIGKYFDRFVTVDRVLGVGFKLEHYFVKFRAWQRTEYERAIYIGADTLPLRNFDEMMACPTKGQPTCGVEDRLSIPAHRGVNGDFIMYIPNNITYNALREEVRRPKTRWFGGPYDQGCINAFLKPKFLHQSYFLDADYPYVENVTVAIHFSSYRKPWAYATPKYRKAPKWAYYYDNLVLWFAQERRVIKDLVDSGILANEQQYWDVCCGGVNDVIDTSVFPHLNTPTQVAKQ